MNCVNCQKQYTGNRKYCSTKCFNEFNVVDFEELKEKEDKIVHNNPFECVICKARFKTETMLNTHTLFEHETFRPYCGTDDSSQNEKILNYIVRKFDEALHECFVACPNSFFNSPCEYWDNIMMQERKECVKCDWKKSDVKGRWLNPDAKIYTHDREQLSIILAGWTWIEKKKLEGRFEKRFKLHGVINAIYKSDEFNKIKRDSEQEWILRKLGINLDKKEEQKRIWIENKSLRDSGLTKEVEFISEMIYGTGGDYDARNRNRINVIKLLYFKEDGEE